MDKPLRLYNLSREYLEYISIFDRKLMYTMEDKRKRPFVGIVFEINNIPYFAPLTSPKQKHKRMKNSLDFLKINHGEYGTINFNNMLSVPLDECKVIVFKDQDNIAYAELLKNQYYWCNTNRSKILKVASNLYHSFINDKLIENVKQRCCDFKYIELKYLEYQAIKEVAATDDSKTAKPTFNFVSTCQNEDEYER